MKRKYNVLSAEQIEFLQQAEINVDVEPDELMEAVGDYLTLRCLDENYNPNTEGIMCEEILDILADI